MSLNGLTTPGGLGEGGQGRTDHMLWWLQGPGSAGHPESKGSTSFTEKFKMLFCIHPKIHNLLQAWHGILVERIQEL